jgi:hypothetical protein
MSSQSPVDPYQPGSYLVEPSARAPVDPRRRPGWFITICVIAIALGGTGLMHSLYAIAALTVGDPMERMLNTGPADEMQEDFQDDVHAIEDRYYAALMPLALARLAITICLVVGGVGCLGGKPWARNLLLGTMAAGLLFEICDTVVQSFLAVEMSEAFRGLGKMMDEQNPSPPGAPPNLAETVMVGTMWVMMCVYYVCQLGKLIYYLGGLLYLRRPSLNPLFEMSPEMAMPAGS